MIFGDPGKQARIAQAIMSRWAKLMLERIDDGQAVANVDSSETLIICHTGDDICLGGDLILLPHLTYGEDAMTAASFIVSAAGA